MKNITVLLFLIVSVCYGQNMKPLGFGSIQTIDSFFLNEKKEIWISFPEDFEKHKNDCSILILLDGDEYFGMAKNIQNLYQFDEKMPATVIVALPSTIESRWKYFTPTNSENFTGKKEDDALFKSTGNFPKFADFVENEVIKKLESDLEIQFKNKTIFGHSLGGLAVMNFYHYKSQIFENYICASPSLLWDDFFYNNYYESIFPTNNKDNRKIFFSSGNPDINGYKFAVEDLYHNMKTKIIDSDKNIMYKHYSSEDHGTSGIRSLLDGLEFIYKK